MDMMTTRHELIVMQLNQWVTSVLRREAVSILALRAVYDVYVSPRGPPGEYRANKVAFGRALADVMQQRGLELVRTRQGMAVVGLALKPVVLPVVEPTNGSCGPMNGITA